MHRLAVDDIELPNAIQIRKGEQMAIPPHSPWSEADYEDPDKLDGYRFLKRRKLPSYEHRSHLISTSNDETAFSHGKHAFPERFFPSTRSRLRCCTYC